MDVKSIQEALKCRGFDPGPIDGILGPKTEAAIVAFKKSIGYRPRPYVGPLTRAALFDDRSKQPAGDGRKSTPWLKVAATYLGTREIKGKRHNPKIVRWWKMLGLPYRDDETPWCAGFTNGVMMEAGFRAPRSAAARSWEWENHGIVLNGPAVGSIVSFYRGKKNGPLGHIGFVVGRDQHGHLMVLGGNQRNAVRILPFSRKRVLSYRWPDGYPPPTKVGFHRLPVVTSDGRVSRNEA